MANHDDDGIENGTTRRDLLKLGGIAAIGGVAASALADASAASATERDVTSFTKTQGDFNLSNRFSVEIDGILVNGVHGVTNPSSTVDASTQPPTITTAASLTRDFGVKSDWFSWHQDVVNGKVSRKSISIIFYNEKKVVSGRLNLFNCLPTSWEGPALNARSSGHATETIQISWETTELKAGAK